MIEALRNKAIMEGLISDDESSNDCWKRWKSHEINYHDYDEGEHENETHNKGHELCGIKTREVSVFQIKRYKMIQNIHTMIEENMLPQKKMTTNDLYNHKDLRGRNVAENCGEIPLFEDLEVVGVLETSSGCSKTEIFLN
ncbi:hypothetical protein Tco_0909070 [Tanacetum coccineum]|uniref:Uncharacterized protein n=1 Tax=Tanacetum coccineum TaxID=301880 RepID=A0ABQ5CQ06_9ASTR